jgi:hypothetical protein
MNETQTRVADLLKASVGDPPGRVTVQAVRRQRARRQVRVAGLATAVAVIAAVGVGTAFRLEAAGPATGTAPPAGVPRYYAEQGSSQGHELAVIRATSTGAVTATFGCPWPKMKPPVIYPVAADSQRAFFMVCQAFYHQSPGDARIYQFHVTASGRVGGYAMIPGGDLGTVMLDRMVVAPDGSEVAVLEVPGAAVSGPGATTQARIVVINTRTGAHAVWRNAAPGTGAVRFDVLGLSFGSGGRELAFLGDQTCGLGQNPARCQPLDQQVRVLAPAASGGVLSDSRIVLRRIEPASTLISDAVLSSDDSTLTIATESFPSKPRPSTVRVWQIALRSGRQHVIYQVQGASGVSPLLIFSPDASGRHFLIEAGSFKHPVAGWIDHGRVIKLKPFDDGNIYDVW